MNVKQMSFCDQCDAAIQALKPGIDELHCPHQHARFSRKSDGGVVILFDHGYEPKSSVTYSTVPTWK